MGLPTKLVPGDRAPQFTLPGSGGCNVSLADSVGRENVLLTFYRGHW